MLNVFLLVAVVLAGACAWTDWKTGHMPNWLTLGPLALSPLAHVIAYAIEHKTLSGDAWVEALYSLGGALACGLVPYLLFMKNAIGGGDVKAFAAIGAILGANTGIEAELFSFFMACLIAPAFLAYEGKLMKTMKNAFMLTLNPILPQARRKVVEPEMMSWFRMGPAMFLGTLTAAILAARLPNR